MPSENRSSRSSIARAYHGSAVPRGAALALEWDTTYAAIMLPPPTARDVEEARLLASRPDLLAMHVEVLRGLRDEAELRRLVDAELGATA